MDAESGHWIGPFAVIGAGADSFFEYAFKSHILLSGQEVPNRTAIKPRADEGWMDPNVLFNPLSESENSPDSFLAAWHHAHSAIKRHLYDDREHPHYVNVNLYTGSVASNWVDSLGAYYSGLLTLAGEVEEAIETSLLYTAIWTKYAALPERWSVRDKTVEGGLGWWPLRPEFVESTYFLYRATKDPWYLHVGAMVQNDIQKRCRTTCGFSGLQNVVNGEYSDRMESFFLGETSKYMYLLFDDKHPLNNLNAAFVFTTEGHPLIIPRTRQQRKYRKKPSLERPMVGEYDTFTNTCPVPPALPPLTGSGVAARDDIYHAARMLDLHLIPKYQTTLDALASDAITDEDETAPVQDAGNFFPRNLPAELLPDNGTCAKVYQPVETTLEFASNIHQINNEKTAFNLALGQSILDRTAIDQIRVLTLSSLKLTMHLEEGDEREWRVTRLNGVALGRDEFAVMDRSILGEVSDSRFNLVRDPVVVKVQHLHRVDTDMVGGEDDVNMALRAAGGDPAGTPKVATLVKSLYSRMVASLERASPHTNTAGVGSARLPFDLVINQTGLAAVGIGAAPVPVDGPPLSQLSGARALEKAILPWTTVYDGGSSCNGTLPEEAARDHQVLVMRRGGCSFSEKLAAIPAYKPSASSLQVVVLVSDEQDDRADYYDYVAGSPNMVRPLLDEIQYTPNGIPRRHPIPMVMVGGGDIVYQQLNMADRIGLTRRYYVESQGVRVRNIIIDEGDLERTL